jgi:NDP-sugar pyrophosphorylase family protein
MFNQIQLIIPATGIGSRFKERGVSTSKPLITPNGESFLSHIFSMYPEVKDPLIILNKQDRQIDHILQEINKLKPEAQIVKINQHKLGPSYTIWEARNYINREKKIIVNYIDFYACWNWHDMYDQLSNCDGSILTYTGFHPHMLLNTKYAYVKLNENALISDIKEKESFTTSPMLENASAGAYGYKTGEILLDALSYQLSKNLTVNSEFYNSLSFQYMLEGKMKVGIINADHFFQWGTPEDLFEWQSFFSLFRKIHSVNKKRSNTKIEGAAVILAAGQGSRLINVTTTPKPLTKILGKDLWTFSLDAIHNLEYKYLAKNNLFKINEELYDLNILNFEKPTSGQADTAFQSISNLSDELQGPISFLSCDNLIFSEDFENAHKETNDFDLLIWAKKHYLPAEINRSGFSWVSVNEKKYVNNLCLKNYPVDLNNSYVIIGNFTFKNLSTAKHYLHKCLNKIDDTRSEIYLDHVIVEMLQDKLRVKIHEINDFYSVGTETEFDVIKYWERCEHFNKLTMKGLIS